MDAALHVVKKIPATLSASSRFDGFRREPLHGVRIREVEMDPALEAMKSAWMMCRISKDNNGVTNLGMNYCRMLELMDKRGYAAKDIERFSISLAEFQNEENFPIKAGLYLSALMNASEDTGFVIHTAHLGGSIENLGYHNSKDIKIDGHAGNGIGYDMHAGSIIVDGDAGGYVGAWMNGGSIIVKGDATDTAGTGMEGGAITIEGDALGWVGNKMRDGTITINGNAAYYAGSLMAGGTIIVNGHAGIEIGQEMEGGKLILNGGYGDISRHIRGGMIFLGEKLIFPK